MRLASLRTLYSLCPLACMTYSCAHLNCLAYRSGSHYFSVCAHDTCKQEGKKGMVFKCNSCLPWMCVNRADA